MKKVFLFLMSALVCGIMMTSCGKDDDGGGVALTNLRVEPSSVSLPVGGTQQIKVTNVPDNATGVTYEWTTSDDKVATVSASGLITVTGIGTATVTVTSGTVKANVAVTGTAKSLTVTDDNGATTGTYPFADEDVVFTLTAAIDPAGTALTWTVDAQTVTVSPSADGLTATVTIKDEGNAVVTVTGGGLTATYVISTQSILESAVGYWTFDDPANILKATIGNDLELGGWDDKEKEIAPSAGPTADNGAINIPMYNFLKCRHGILPNGPEGSTHVNEFTIMFDLMEENAARYHALINNRADEDLNQVDEASMYLKSGGRIGTGQIGDSPNGTTEDGKWYRVVFSVKGTADDTGYYDYYLNGELLKANTVTNLADNERHTLHPRGVVFCGDSRPDKGEGGDGYDFGDDGLHVAAIAIWDRPLTAVEIASLGMFAVDSE